MKKTLLPICFTLLTAALQAQVLTDPYLKLVPGSASSKQNRLELSSDIDTTWSRWRERGYNYGFDPKLTPMYTTVNGILSTPYMIKIRGSENEKNRKRWGYHVFEGYAKDDKSRITMLVNKHIEENRPVAELYYYGNVYGQSDAAYNWFRIGSDVRQHSYLFSLNKAIFYGSLKLTNALTLGNVGQNDVSPEPITKGDVESSHEQDAKYVNYQALKGGDNGTMFYDKDNNIVVIKVNDKWMKVVVEELPKTVKYPF